MSQHVGMQACACAGAVGCERCCRPGAGQSCAKSNTSESPPVEAGGSAKRGRVVAVDKIGRRSRCTKVAYAACRWQLWLKGLPMLAVDARGKAAPSYGAGHGGAWFNVCVGWLWPAELRTWALLAPWCYRPSGGALLQSAAQAGPETFCPHAWHGHALRSKAVLTARARVAGHARPGQQPRWGTVHSAGLVDGGIVSACLLTCGCAPPVAPCWPASLACKESRRPPGMNIWRAASPRQAGSTGRGRQYRWCMGTDPPTLMSGFLKLVVDSGTLKGIF
jgi:hypothetical protein